MRSKNNLKRPQLGLVLFVAASVVTCFLMLAGEKSTLAQSDEIAPGDNLEVVGVPKSPKSLATGQTLHWRIWPAARRVGCRQTRGMAQRPFDRHLAHSHREPGQRAQDVDIYAGERGV